MDLLTQSQKAQIENILSSSETDGAKADQVKTIINN